PATPVSGRARQAQDACRLPRCERDVEAVERTGETVAERLDERLFACPTMEESPRPIAGVEGEVRLVLPGGEEARGDSVGIAHRTHGLDVDADLASVCERVSGQILAMREVEAQIRGRMPWCERGLAVPPVHQLDRLGPRSQPRAEQPSQQRPCHNEPVAVAVEREPIRALSLDAREQGAR